MQIQIFTVPVFEGEEELDAMNKFLRSHRIAEIQKSYISSDNLKSYWSFCITYLDNVKVAETEVKKGKIDYRNVLDEKKFATFCDMRKIRKQIAEKEAIPPFAVFTDAELAEIVKLDTLTLASMQSIEGIGIKKVEKYGSYFLGNANETSGELDKPNS